MDLAEAQLKKERDVVAKKAEKLKTFKPGTPDFNRWKKKSPRPSPTGNCE